MTIAADGSERKDTKNDLGLDSGVPTKKKKKQDQLVSVDIDMA